MKVPALLLNITLWSYHRGYCWPLSKVQIGRAIGFYVSVRSSFSSTRKDYFSTGTQLKPCELKPWAQNRGASLSVLDHI